MSSFLKRSFVLVVLATWAVPAQAIELTLDSSGVRGACSNPFNHARFYHVEAYLNWNLPWRWKPGDDWTIQSRLDLTGGWMNGRGEDAVFGSVGPSFELGWKEFPLTLDVGCSPTVLSREQFGHTDFGTVFQFTTHAGLNWKLGSRWTLGCRVEHLSNANIGPSNPGVNFYSLGAGWRF